MRPRQKASRVDFPCKGGIRGLGNRYRALFFRGRGRRKKGDRNKLLRGKRRAATLHQAESNDASEEINNK